MENIHKFHVHYKGKFPSINQMYLIGRGGRNAWTYINPLVTEYKKELRIALSAQNIKEIFSKYDPVKHIVNIHLLFCFQENFWVRDVDNLAKATTDAVAEICGIDDRFYMKNTQEKVLNDLNLEEHLVVVMEVMPRDNVITWSKLNDSN